MFKLKLLIVFLLVGCKAISQNATQKDSVVVLTEKQARAVATDLVRYDACKAMSTLQEKRIANLMEQTKQFEDKISKMDTLIVTQKEFIERQASLLNKPFKPEIHGYGGVNTVGFTINNPYLYGKVQIQFKKLNIGAVYYVQPTSPTGYGVYAEYRLF